MLMMMVMTMTLMMVNMIMMTMTLMMIRIMMMMTIFQAVWYVDLCYKQSRSDFIQSKLLL